MGIRATAVRVEALEPRDQTLHGTYWFDLRTRRPAAARVKRAIDLIGSLALIVLLAPLMLLVAALIRLTSSGPAIFVQRRIGFRCNEFGMYKFRSMVANAEELQAELRGCEGIQGGPDCGTPTPSASWRLLDDVPASTRRRDSHLTPSRSHSGPPWIPSQPLSGESHFFKVEEDPRVTPLGRFLRRSSLDELPQLFNVLEGSMSLVGPRPLLVSDLDRLPMRAQMRRFSVRPGITGLWQVSGRSATSEDDRLRLDREYINNWSLALDCKILLRTVGAVISGRGAV